MAAFSVAYIAGLGVGYSTLALVDIGGAQAPLIGIAFTAVSMLPVGLTRLAQPAPPRAASIALRQAWRISPVGMAGMFAVGGLSMAISGFVPIHATAKGYNRDEVAMLLASMPIGTLILQFPLGWVSDRIDRRTVLAAASALAVAAGVMAIGFDGRPLVLLIVVYLIWDGASESIYSLASAHANDRAGKEDMVALSSALLFAWAIAGFVVPGIITGLSAVSGRRPSSTCRSRSPPPIACSSSAAPCWSGRCRYRRRGSSRRWRHRRRCRSTSPSRRKRRPRNERRAGARLETAMRLCLS